MPKHVMQYVQKYSIHSWMELVKLKMILQFIAPLFLEVYINSYV